MGTPTNVYAGKATVGIDFSPDVATPGNNAYVDLGFTIDGFDIEFEPDVVPILVDQIEVPADAVLASVGVKFTLKLAESTQTTLLTALAGSQAVSTTGIRIGDPTGDVLDSFAMQLVGPGPNSQTRTITIYKCTASGEAKQAFIRDGIAYIEAGFAAISDGTNPLLRLVDA